MVYFQGNRPNGFPPGPPNLETASNSPFASPFPTTPQQNSPNSPYTEDISALGSSSHTNSSDIFQQGDLPTTPGSNGSISEEAAPSTTETPQKARPKDNLRYLGYFMLKWGVPASMLAFTGIPIIMGLSLPLIYATGRMAYRVKPDTDSPLSGPLQAVRFTEKHAVQLLSDFELPTTSNSSQTGKDPSFWSALMERVKPMSDELLAGRLSRFPLAIPLIQAGEKLGKQLGQKYLKQLMKSPLFKKLSKSFGIVGRLLKHTTRWWFAATHALQTVGAKEKNPVIGFIKGMWHFALTTAEYFLAPFRYAKLLLDLLRPEKKSEAPVNSSSGAALPPTGQAISVMA